MYKRIIASIVTICLFVTISAFLPGCSKEKSSEYPVTIGNVTINEEPRNIVVLSDCLADIISYIGYDIKMVGKSTSCDQEFLSIVPSVGTAEEPDVDAVINYETDLVIADNSLSSGAKSKLEEAGITVISMLNAESMTELEALYVNLGTALGGNITGKSQGQESYKALLDTLESFKSTVPNSVIKTAAYLYINDEGALCTFTSNSIETELLSYCGAINVFSSQETEQVDLSQLKMSTPTYIFYDDENVLNYLKSNDELSTLSALTSNRVFQIPKKDFSRQGITYEDTIYFMIDTMFVKSEATPDSATPNELEAEIISN